MARVDHRRGHRGVDAPGQAQNHAASSPTWARIFSTASLMMWSAHHPGRAGQPQMPMHKARPACAWPCTVWVTSGWNCTAVVAAFLVGHAGDGTAVACRGHQLEAGRQLGDLVAMAHPDVEHAKAFRRGEVGDVLAAAPYGRGPAPPRSRTPRWCATSTLPPSWCGHGLHAVADAQHRHAQAPDRFANALAPCRLLSLVDAGMAAGQDHAFERAVGGAGLDPVVADVAGVHLAVHARLRAPGGRSAACTCEPKSRIRMRSGVAWRASGRASETASRQRQQRSSENQLWVR